MSKLLKLCRCCVDCWKGVQPKYKQLITHLYPAENRDANAAEMGLGSRNVHPQNLSKYAMSSPNKLTPIGKALLKRIRTDLKLLRFKYSAMQCSTAQ